MLLTDINQSILHTLNLPRISQLGIVVKDLDQSIQEYKAIFNIHPWYRANSASHEARLAQRPIEINTEMAFAYSGRLQLELIQVKGGDRNIYSEHFRQRGEGLHHLGFIVGDMDAKIKTMDRLGIKVAQSGQIKSTGGAITRYAYLDTRELCGYYIELLETRLLGINVGQSKLMMNLGLITGDTAIITP